MCAKDDNPERRPGLGARPGELGAVARGAKQPVEKGVSSWVVAALIRSATAGSGGMERIKPLRGLALIAIFANSFHDAAFVPR
jgi:hypothetical protein